MRRSVIDAPIPAMIHAEDGEVQAISSVWAEYSGYSHEELPTIMDWIETAFPPQRADQAGIDRYFRKCAERRCIQSSP